MICVKVYRVKDDILTYICGTRIYYGTRNSLNVPNCALSRVETWRARHRFWRFLSLSLSLSLWVGSKYL